MISVIFSSKDGARTLPVMLQAFEQLTYPKDDYEIIAVDNCSSDQTRNILESFADRLPITVCECIKPGKNAALNLAIQRAKGDLVVFTDDDIVPIPSWLDVLKQKAEIYRDVELFGGRIIPIWPRTPPPWLLQTVPLGVAYGITPLEIEDGPIDPGMIWGANMMIRRGILDKGHRFNEDVGPRPGQYIMGSEVEFNYRLSAAGVRTYFCNAAVVGHQIRLEHLEPNWLERRAYRFGRNIRHQDGSNCNPERLPEVLGLPRWRIAAMFVFAFKSMREKIAWSRRPELSSSWEFWFNLGYVSQHFKECLRRARL